MFVQNILCFLIVCRLLRLVYVDPCLFPRRLLVLRRVGSLHNRASIVEQILVVGDAPSAHITSRRLARLRLAGADTYLV